MSYYHPAKLQHCVPQREYFNARWNLKCSDMQVSQFCFYQDGHFIEIDDVVAYGWVVTSPCQLTEVTVKQLWIQLIFGWVTASHWPVFKSCCQPCYRVIGQTSRIISCRLCPPSSDGYPVEQNAKLWTAVTAEMLLTAFQKKWDM